MLNAEIEFGELGGDAVRMLFDKVDEGLKMFSETDAFLAEFAFNGADVCDAFDAFFVDCEIHSTETTADVVGGVERELALVFKKELEGALDVAAWHFI